MRNKYTHQQLHQQEEHEEQHYKQQRSTKFLPMLCSLSTKQVIKLSASHRRSSSTSSTTSSTVSDDPLSPKVGCMGQVKRNNKVVGFPPRSSTRETSTCSNNITIKCHEQIISNYSTNGAIVKYHMLKRFFSSKSLTSSPTTITAATSTAVAVARSRTHKGGKSAGRNNTGSNNHNNNRGIKGVVLSDHDHHHSVIPRSKIDENCNGDIIGVNSKKKNNNKNEDEKGSFVNLMDLDPPLPVVKQKQQQQQEEENLNLWKRRSKGVPLKSLQVQVAQPPPCNLPLQATTV